MHDARFDALARQWSGVLARGFGRRDAMRLGVAASLAIGAGGATEARRRRKPRPCGICRTRRGRRCRPKPNGTSCGECRACQGGRCLAADGAGCAECLTCQAGGCAALAGDGAACGIAGQCSSGRCFEPPTCSPAGADCFVLEPERCCSGICPFLPGLQRCAVSMEGDACLSNDDCDAGLSCRVFICVTT